MQKPSRFSGISSLANCEKQGQELQGQRAQSQACLWNSRAGNIQNKLYTKPKLYRKRKHAMSK